MSPLLFLYTFVPNDHNGCGKMEREVQGEKAGCAYDKNGGGLTILVDHFVPICKVG